MFASSRERLVLTCSCLCGQPIQANAPCKAEELGVVVLDGQQSPDGAWTPLTGARPVHRGRASQMSVAAYPSATQHPGDAPHLLEDHPMMTPSEIKGRLRTLLPALGSIRTGTHSSKILVVDDDEDIRLVLQEVLAEAGFQVEGAADGLEALEHLRQEGGWVVLLDVMMPRLNGWQVVKQLQQDPALLKDSKIVLMSAGWRLDSIEQRLNSEIVVASLRKPVDLDELLILARYLAGEEER